MSYYYNEPEAHIVYKITNNLTGDYYVGVHNRDDFLTNDYWGSGKVIEFAIEQFGQENFTKEILHRCKSKWERDGKEIEIVDWNFINRDTTYNLAKGGPKGRDFTPPRFMSAKEKRMKNKILNEAISCNYQTGQDQSYERDRWEAYSFDSDSSSSGGVGWGVGIGGAIIAGLAALLLL